MSSTARQRRVACLLVCAALAVPLPLLAQENAPAWPGYMPKFYRWDEDYGWLKNRPALPFLLRLKFLPLTNSGETYVSLGGEYRLRFDSYDHPDFGVRNAPEFTSWQQRFLAHADIHVNDDFRVFVQLGDDIENGRKPGPRPADRSNVDLAQGFFDIGIGPESKRWRLRIGRQEVGIGRYITVRDSTNIRRTFDGVRLDGPLDGWTITGLAAHATRNKPGAFDDDPDPNDQVALLMAEHALPWQELKIDLTAIQRENDSATYAVGTGTEHRGTLGARLFGTSGPWDMDGQVSYQTGSFTPADRASLTIEAWGAAFEGGRVVDAPWSPRLALRVDFASGNDNPNGHRLGTFDLPYPNLSYLTDATIFTPRNIHNLQPFVALSPSSMLSFTAGAEFLWRNTTKDAVYSPLNTPVIPPGGSAHYVATEPYVRWSWSPMPLVEFQGGIVHAIPGGALLHTGGHRDLDFAFSSITLQL